MKNILSKYLPYNLTIKSKASDIIYLVEGIVGDNLIFSNQSLPIDEIGKTYVILLRPKSHLDKEIFSLGKTFVPINELAKIYCSNAEKITPFKGVVSNYFYFHCQWNNEDSFEELIINESFEPWFRSYFDKSLNGTGRNVVDVHVGMEKLHEWKFDVYNLIDKGFAEKI